MDHFEQGSLTEKGECVSSCDMLTSQRSSNHATKHTHTHRDKAKLQAQLDQANKTLQGIDNEHAAEVRDFVCVLSLFLDPLVLTCFDSSAAMLDTRNIYLCSGTVCTEVLLCYLLTCADNCAAHNLQVKKLTSTHEKEVAQLQKDLQGVQSDVVSGERDDPKMQDAQLH